MTTPDPLLAALEALTAGSRRSAALEALHEALVSEHSSADVSQEQNETAGASE